MLIFHFLLFFQIVWVITFFGHFYPMQTFPTYLIICTVIILVMLAVNLLWLMPVIFHYFCMTTHVLAYQFLLMWKLVFADPNAEKKANRWRGDLQSKKKSDNADFESLFNSQINPAETDQRSWNRKQPKSPSRQNSAMGQNGIWEVWSNSSKFSKKLQIIEIFYLGASWEYYFGWFIHCLPFMRLGLNVWWVCGNVTRMLQSRKPHGSIPR